MNIVILSEKFWPEGSGGELATYLYVKDLIRKKDLFIRVITGTPQLITLHELLDSDKVDFTILDFMRTKHRISLWRKLVSNIDILLDYLKDADILYIPGSSIIVAPYVRKRFKDIKIIYHLHGYMPLSYNSAVYYPYEKRKKRIYIDTCRYASRRGFKHLVACLLLHHHLTSIVRKSLKYVDKIICVSKRQEYIINDAIPWTREKTTVIYNPPPPDVIGIEKKLCKEPLLLFTGGDNPVKGFNIVIKVAEYLKKRKTMYKLVITNNVNNKIAKSIKKREIGTNIEFTGRISREKILDLYSRAWILLFPSIYEEPLPYTFMEALLTGTIPISFPVGGVPEMIEDTPLIKYLVRQVNPSEFAMKTHMAIEAIRHHSYFITDLVQTLSRRINKKDSTNKLYNLMANIL